MVEAYTVADGNTTEEKESLAFQGDGMPPGTLLSPGQFGLTIQTRVTRRAAMGHYRQPRGEVGGFSFAPVKDLLGAAHGFLNINRNANRMT